MMSKQTTNTFAKLHDALERYEREIEATLKVYQQSLAAAKQEAALYRDADGQLAKKKEELIAPARAHIAAADRVLSKVAGEVAGALREALAQRVAERPDAGFVSLLQAYSSLGVKLTPGELKALVPSAGGNYAALRMLAAVAEQSDYRLSVPDFSAYEADVRDIERLTRVPLMVAPEGLWAEAADVLPDKPVFASNGALLYSTGRPSAGYVAAQSNAFKALRNRIDGAADRWSVDFVPTLSELQSFKDANGETVTPEAQRAEAVQKAADAVELDERIPERVAAEEAAEEAQAGRRAAEIRAQFERR